MQAITTKFFGPTSHRGSRIKATTASGLSVTIADDLQSDSVDIHREALRALFTKHNLTHLSWGKPNGWFYGQTRGGYVWVRWDCVNHG